MGNPLEIENLQSYVFGERRKKSDFEKCEVVDWINAAEDRNNYGQSYYTFFFQISKL
jgi:hypothetical protein